MKKISQNIPSNLKCDIESANEEDVMRQLATFFSEMTDKIHSTDVGNVMRLIDDAHAQLFQISKGCKTTTNNLVEIKSLLPGLCKQIDQLYSFDDECYIPGISTGFTYLDAMTSGLQGGDLVIVAGRPSMGKAAFSLNIAQHAATSSGAHVAVFSMKKSAKQLVMRMIASIVHLDLNRIKTGRLDSESWDKLLLGLGKLNEAPIYIEDTSGLSVSDIWVNSWRLHRQCGKLNLIVIDSLQSITGVAGNDSTVDILEITRSLKALAQELNVPVIVTSTLEASLESRSDKHPILSDLDESGAIERNADVVFLIHRDDIYNPEDLNNGIAEITIAKHRNGLLGNIHLKFKKEYTLFENVLDDDSN